MPRDQDLRYAVKVQDAQLKELSRNIRALNKEIGASERTTSTAGSAAGTGYAKADAQAKKARASTIAFGSSAKDALKFGVGAGVGFQALGLATRFLQGLGPAAKESERSLGRLETQLDAVDLSADEYLGTIEKAVRAQTVLAGVVDDELVRDSLTNMLRSTRNVTRAVELNALALDIAIAKNISLETASRLVARVYAGNTGALGRYGITIDKGATSTEALTILQQRFAGQAQRAGETAEGSFGRFHFRVEELQEQLGGGLIPKLEEVANAAAGLFAVLEKLDSQGGGGGSGESFLSKVFTTSPEFVEKFTDNLKLLRANMTLLAQGRFKVPEGTAEEMAGLTADAADELAVTDRLAASVADTFDRMVGKIAKVGDALQDKLRARMLDALDVVEEKAFDSFDAQTDAILAAQDSVTESMLRSFDKTTEQMLDRIRVVVKVGERQFEIGRGQLTPAERELEALEKIDRTRNVGRELFDARQELGQQLLIGDPEGIREAKRRVEDAESERKQIKLEARAETEREAADKALEAEGEALRESRDAQRRDLAERRSLHRDHLADRRAQMRDNLQAELAAQRKALENGKRAAANAQTQILATLRSYGADYKGVGKDLGGKFLNGFKDALAVGLQVKPVPVQPSPDVRDLRDAAGAARGGIVGQLGVKGPSDTVPAWLTPGEMILTKGDQRMLASSLGSGAIGWPLLGKIRTGLGFAEGGVVDDDLLRMLLQRFSSTLAQDAVTRGTGLADPRLLKGGLSEAERKALSPIHIQSKVKNALGARYSTLDRTTKLTLLGELAQRQAHPQRAGLIRVPSGGGYELGGNFRDPGSSAGMSFGGPMTWNISESGNPRRTADIVRRELNRLQSRNGKRRRGRNAGSIAGLRAD